MPQKFFKLILPLTAFLVPLFFLPLTVDFFATNKQLLLIIIASFCLFFFGLQQLLNRQIKIALNPATRPLLLLAVVFVTSSLLQSSNHLFALSGITSTITALVIIFITTTSTLDQNVILPTLYAFIVSLGLNSLVVIYQYSGLSAKLTNIDWLKSNSFNLLGGPLAFLTFAIPLLPINIYLAFKNKNNLHKILLFVAAALTILASIISVSLILPKNNQPTVILLPLSAGWAIAVDVFKNLRTALIGSGPESFLFAYTQLKPIAINHTPFWNLRFSYSSNEFFQLLTTVGLLGFLSFALALIRPLIASFQKNSLAQTSLTSAATRLLLLLFVITNLLVPSNVVLYALTFIALILVCLDLQSHQPNFITASFKDRLTFVPLIVFLSTLVFLGFSSYFRFQVYAAETYFYQSLVAAQKNQGTDTYNLQIKAIAEFPANDRLRVTYSQTNLALANSIASKTNPSDQDKANVAQLIQQSIREAKAATALEPTNVIAWENLAQVYRQLINVAQGADQWSVAAYSQAIALDPINPQLRLDLGGLYYSLKDYDSAIRLFQQAVEAKADWANAHYNLSHAYLDNKQYAQAIASMRVTAQLVDPTSSDYQKAQDELKALEKQYPQAKPNQPINQSTNELTAPSPVPSPTGKLIKLPDASGLNLPPTKPSVTPSPTPK